MAKLRAVGGIAGRVRIASAPTGAPAGACGSKPANVENPPDERIVVWVADVPSGKAPSIEKRTELTSAECDLSPRVQPIVAGTTVNVFNDDRLPHRLVFTHLNANDTLTVMPFTNSGEVVPTQRLSQRAGIVEVRGALYPWMRAYIAVFESPYFTMADAGGGFSIDSLPPGTYTVMAWAPGLAQPLSRRVTVSQDATATVELGTPAAAPDSVRPDSGRPAR